MRAGQQVFRAVVVVLAAMMAWSGAEAAAPGRLCNSHDSDSECWREMAERPGCHLWRNKSFPQHTIVSWSGSCLGGVADGPGVLDFRTPEITYESMVTLQEGRAHGRVTGQTSHGNVYEGQSVFGKYQGRWITYGPDGACRQVIHWSEGWVEHHDSTCEEHAAEVGAAALAAEFDAIQGRLAQLDAVRQAVTAAPERETQGRTDHADRASDPSGASPSDSMRFKAWTRPFCVVAEGVRAQMPLSEFRGAINLGVCVGVVDVEKAAACDTRTAQCDWPCDDAQCYSEWEEWEVEPQWPHASYADEARAVAEAAKEDPEAMRADALAKVEGYRERFLADTREDAPPPQGWRVATELPESAAGAPETGADGSGPLHGSIAFSQEADGGYAWGIAWSFDSAAGALAEATDQCRAYGGTSCHEAGWFEEACGALAIGDENGYGTGWGATIADAERDALAQCRAVNRNCRVEVARCSQSQEAGGQGRLPMEDRVAESAPEQVGPCRIFFGSQTGEQFEAMFVTALPEKYFEYIQRDYTRRADWSGPCADGLATGEGEATFEYVFHFPPSSRKSIYRGHARDGRFHGPGWMKAWYDYRSSEVYVYRSSEVEEYVAWIDEGEFREGVLYEGTTISPSHCETSIVRQGHEVGREEGKC